MIVNFMHFKQYSWDKRIEDVGYGLFPKAKVELSFWLENLENLNFRPFVCPPPDAIGWVDASGYALGGLMCKLKPEAVGLHKPLTADNLLRVAGPQHQGLAAENDCAQSWLVDKMRQTLQGAAVRTEHDLDLTKVEDVKFVHRNLFTFEMSSDSNEREMLGARELINGSKSIIENANVLLYLDNINAASIFMKGSPKYRLNKYAIELDNLSMKWNFKLTAVGIPRDLNKFSDEISKCLDLEDYAVTDEFFMKACKVSNLDCNFDRFASNYNTKVKLFNSSSFCVGSRGVDCFNYDWKGYANWLFPPPRLVARTVNHLKICKAEGLLLAPEWKAAHFYPHLESLALTKYLVKKYDFSGKNVFLAGCDKSSYFNPEFNCRVGVWHFDFKL